MVIIVLNHFSLYFFKVFVSKKFVINAIGIEPLFHPTDQKREASEVHVTNLNLINSKEDAKQQSSVFWKPTLTGY